MNSSYLDKIVPTIDQLNCFSERIPKIIEVFGNNSKVNSPTLGFLAYYHDYFKAFLEKKMPRSNPRCYFPEHYFVLSVDGMIRPCFFISDSFELNRNGNPLFSSKLDKINAKIRIDSNYQKNHCRTCMQTMRKYDNE
jgi:hypothetical protein